MLKLATLIENPGEPASESRYHDPRELAALGYNAQVIYETTALSGVTDPQVVADPEMRRWLQNSFDQVGRKIEQAREAGLGVYLCYDALVLPTDVLRGQETLACKGRPEMLCPASEQTLERVVAGAEAHLARWPQIDGLVLRFGDSDAGRLPHLTGNDLYVPHCPRCSQLGRADRIAGLIRRFYEAVVVRRAKRLIVRAWNVRPGGLHDTAELATRVAAMLPGEEDDPNLILSFKFTQTDFWRYQAWNPASLAVGRRPMLYELQCQREFEAKGAVPNWQPPLWQQGAPESRDQTPVAGLAHLGERVNLVGLWAWVRGGGWGGPFIREESWIDANVYAVPRLAENPQLDLEALAREWVTQRRGISDEQAADRLVNILLRSAEDIREAFYIGPFARSKSTPWHPNADWIQDDQIDAAAAWRMIQRLSSADLEAAVLENQRVAERISRDCQALQERIAERDRDGLEPLVNTLFYTESLYEALRDLLAGLAAYRRYQRSGSSGDADIARQKLLTAQSHWNHHTQRHAATRGAATAFREVHFWDLTERILDELARSGG